MPESGFHHPSSARGPRAFAAALALALGVAAVGASPAPGATQLNLAGRIVIDGRTGDYTAGEAIFGINDSLDVPEESATDSRWQDNDIAQIHLTWDADSVYFAADGIINGNNMILLWDVGNPHPGVFASTGVAFDGLSDMTNLNSWRRNFVFAEGFRPDFFGATWDGNTAPRLLTATNANNVTEQQPAGSAAGSGLFRAVASFQGTQADRAMEFALPWYKFLGFSTPVGLVRRFSPALGDTVVTLPEGVRYIRVAGVITAGGDGTGGPDSAPDNLSGHEVDSSIQVTIDNWAIIDIDAANDETGGDGSDRIPDLGIEPRDRVTFNVRPPVVPIRFEFDRFNFDRPYLAPERNEIVRFDFDFSPKLPPEQFFRKVRLSAEIYDLHGRRVRTLYEENDPANLARDPRNPVIAELDQWDGRDDDGRVVDGGLYILRMILEPELARLTRTVGVLR
jgi:hypothetical protein